MPTQWRSAGAAVPRLIGTGVRVLIIAILVLFIAIQGSILLGPHGIVARYTPVQDFTVFSRIMLSDPLTQAGLVDFCVLEATLLVLLANGLPRGRTYPWLLAGLALISFIYPGLACLIFLLFFWRRTGQFRP